MRDSTEYMRHEHLSVRVSFNALRWKYRGNNGWGGVKHEITVNRVEKGG